MKSANPIDKFWRNLYKNSKGFEEPILISNQYQYISTEQILELFGLIKQDNAPGKNNYLRAYVDGNESYELSAEIVNASPSSDLNKWLMGIFKTEKYGLVINGPLCWSDSLGHSVDTFVEYLKNKMLKKFSIAFDLTLFIGNYGYTPFGAHLDDPDHRTLLMNLGPNDKKMILWDPEWMRKKYGNISNYYYPEKIQDEGQIFTLKPGDMFLLPSKYYHVGYSDKYSITVALIIKKKNPLDLMLEELKKECESNCAKFFDTSFESAADFEKGETSLSHYLQANHLSTNTLLSRALKRAASNFNFLRKPNKRSTAIKIQNTTVFEPIGKLEVESIGNKINVFCRGRKIGLPNTIQHIELIDYINQNKSIAMDVLCDRTKLKKGFLEAFIHTLYIYKGINVVEHNKCL